MHSPGSYYLPSLRSDSPPIRQPNSLIRGTQSRNATQARSRQNGRVAKQRPDVSYVLRTELSLLAEQDPQTPVKATRSHCAGFSTRETIKHVIAVDRPRSSAWPAFLVLSRQNANEGRDPSLVPDSCECVSATSLLLDLDTAVFERALVALRRIGLVEPFPKGPLHLNQH
jgi:hypothetical protein